MGDFRGIGVGFQEGFQMGLEFQFHRCQRATAAVLFTALVCVCYKGAKFLFVVCSAASCEVELPVPGQHLATTQGFMDLEFL